MLSIFVHCNDLQDWLWKDSESSDQFIQPEMREYPREELEAEAGVRDEAEGDKPFTAAVRYFPMPSIVLSPIDGEVQPFLNCIRKPDERITNAQRGKKMESFIQALRKKIPVCLSQNQSLQDEAICVFIHFGRGFHVDANQRLYRAWKQLPDSLRESFLCFAITVHGVGINSEWVKDNKLFLPSCETELRPVLDNGCQSWMGSNCPESFLGPRAIIRPHLLNEDSENRPANPSANDHKSPKPVPSTVSQSQLDDMSRLHVWVIADRKNCSDGDCQQWIDEQRDLFKDVPCKSFKSRVIPSQDGNDPMGSVRDAYHGIAGILAAEIKEASFSDRFVGVLDARQFENLKKTTKDNKGMSSLKTVQGLLILAFPEVIWIPVFSGKENAARSDIEIALNLVAGGFNPMFDGTGVRGLLISEHHPGVYRYNRKDVAVTIDEERHFAELAAYTAFRFGYRAYPVSTERLANEVLCKGNTENLPSLAGATTVPDASLVVFEDGDIEFPDADIHQNESHLLGDERDRTWPLLKNANLRVLATAAGPEERIAWKREQENETLPQERPTESTGGESRKFKLNSTASESFQGDFQNLDGGNRTTFLKWLEKSLRRGFNLSAGGMGCVWAFDLVKWVAIIGALGVILFSCPGSLFFALFALFPVVWILGVVAETCFPALFGSNARMRRALIIRSQWRYYPKLYTHHFPRNVIRKDNEDNGEKDGDGNDRKGCWRRVRKLLARMHAAANSPKSYWHLVQKPLGGIFGLRNQCGLPNGRGFVGLLNADAVENFYKEVLHQKKGAIKKDAAITEDKNRGDLHSAFGMTLDIATDLIGRARSIRVRGNGVEDAIHAAVLATCAYELLGHKTPALSIEALGLRHYCEVLAECEFHGVCANLDMDDRLIDIHNSMSQICRASDGTVRENMFASGMAAICDNLADLLRERGRFSEAAFMTRRARFMHRLLLPPVWRNCLAYPEWVIRTPWHCVISFAAMVVAFCVYWEVKVNWNGSIPLTFAKTWEVLVCDEPDLSWPGRDKGGHDTAIQTPTTPSQDGSDKETEANTNTTEAKDSRKVKQQESSPDKCSPEPTNDTISEATYSLFVHTMRQIALLHLAFLGIFFWDAMRKD